jgi:urease accessory protein
MGTSTIMPTTMSTGTTPTMAAAATIMATSTEARVGPDLALVRLLQLASPALPVGAYSYSQGLEAAVEAGLVTDAASARRWIGDMLRHSMARLEAPLWCRLHATWQAGDAGAAREWNDWFIATRETAELRAETLQMGYSLARLLGDLAGEPGGFEAGARRPLRAFDEIAFPTAFAFAAVQWGVAARQGLNAYLWSWLENQVMAAVKAVPLGQTEGQRLLARLGSEIVINLDKILATDVNEMSNYCHGLAVASSRHETQYSRLFRS